jgi:flavin reductase (DIM6/NTAB) family NADH-FMN oxidoreductase RutF
MVEFAAREAMNESSAAVAQGVDEFALADVPKAECETIPCPRVADAPATLECRVTQIIALPGKVNVLVLGEVTGIHLRDDCLVEGRFDVTRYAPLARLGYSDYAAVREVFAMARPG